MNDAAVDQDEQSRQGPPAEGLWLEQMRAELVHWLTEVIPDSVKRGLVRVAELAQAPEFREALFTDVQSFLTAIESEITAYERDPRSFFYDEMLAAPGVLLLTKVRGEGEEALIVALECVFDDGLLADHAIEALPTAPHLSEAQRDRLRSGLIELKARHWVVAGDLLLKGAEGALWDAAFGLGVVDSNRRLIHHPRRPFVSSPNRLIGEGVLPDLGLSYRRYIDRQLFDARGHDLRHARVEHDARAHALYSAAATLGWLDHFAGSALMVELGDRLSRYADRLEAPDAAMSAGVSG